MSPDGDLQFAPSDSLLMSDFDNLTQFDDFHKDLFLSNAMDGIAEEGILEELDCKDDLKLISDVNDAFTTSLKRDDDLDSLKARDNPFCLFIDEETSEASLEFMDMASQLESPAVSDGVEAESMGLTHTMNDSSRVPTKQGEVASLIAANELNCMSLEELDLTPAANSTHAMSPLSSPPLSLALSSATSSAERPPPSLAPLSPLGKAVAAGRSMFKMEAQSLPSADMVTSPTGIKSPCTPSSSTSAFGKSDGGPLLNMVLRGGEVISQPKCAPAQTFSVTAREESSAQSGFDYSHMYQHVPSMQRSQSSHALGQLRMSHCPGPRADDVGMPPACKQEVHLSSASGISLFSPFNTQGLSEQSAGAPMRRVYSTGDLQGFNGMQSFYGMAESVIPEEASGMKIGHYTIEERKMKLHRYRQKRTERNFSKKIKYACRKTLADNRPRVRGRFARSDEMGDSRGSDLPLIDEYEEVTSQCPRRVLDQQAYLMVNNSCVMSSKSLAQFWNTMGMKVAM